MAATRNDDALGPKQTRRSSRVAADQVIERRAILKPDPLGHAFHWQASGLQQVECSIDTDLLSKLHRRHPGSKGEASVECAGRCARLLSKVLQSEGRGQASAHISLDFARYRVLGCEKCRNDVARLRSTLIDDDVPRCVLSQSGAGETRNKPKH